MYIGPWQEYALYRANNTNKTNNSNIDTLKSELQHALLSALDADAASKALEAMNPLLSTMSANEKYNAAFRTTHENPYKRSHIHHTESDDDQSSTRTKLPLIRVSRTNSKDYGPPSQRSISSDPFPSIRTNKKIEPNRRVSSSNSTPILPKIPNSVSESSQSKYDVKHAIATLRMKRELDQTNTMSNKWLWSTATESDSNDNKPKPNKSQIAISKRIVQLKKMKKLYNDNQHMGQNMNMDYESTVDMSDINPMPGMLESPKAPLPPIQSELRSLTASTMQSEISDYDRVAKYFAEDDFDLIPQRSPIVPIEVPIISSPVRECDDEDLSVDGLINWSMNLQLDPP